MLRGPKGERLRHRIPANTDYHAARHREAYLLSQNLKL